MTKTNIRRLGFMLALCISGLPGCGNVVDPGELPVAEISQELTRCGPGATCAAGWTCADRLDFGCHPQCTFPVESVLQTSGTTIPGICPPPFSSWSCCIGYRRADGSLALPYCAVSCPVL